MPRFFFDVDDTPSFVDEEGVELSDEREACSEALSYAGQLLRESTEQSLRYSKPLTVYVKDARHAIVMTIEIRVS